MIRYYLLISILCMSFLSVAQSTNKKAQNSFDDAQQFVRQNIFEDAIAHLQNAVKIDQKFEKAYIQLADIYKRTKNIPKAKENYRLALKAASVQNPPINFVLGELELITGEYDAAKKNFETFLASGSHLDKNYTSKANKYIADCNFAMQAIKNPVSYQPFNMGFYVNSEHKDYFPSFTADGQTIIFTRNVNGNEDFYTSTKKNGDWQRAQPLAGKINTPNYNEGAQSISPDGRYLFFTGCNRPDGLGRCDIFVCKKEGNEWGKPVNLGPTINTKEWESQPSISADGTTLYFLSNRAGGFGGYDIWKSNLTEDGRWGEPTNLGENVNTPYDEATPFIHPDGKTLYFSSDGWPGFGQKDIFISKLQDDGTFSKAKNLGYPINTFNDEFGFVVTANGDEGVFSSNLDGGFGDVDMYRFKLQESLKPGAVTYVKGIVKDRLTKEPLESSVLIINLATSNAAYNETTDKENGEFMAVMPNKQEYSFNVFAKGYTFYSQNFSLYTVDERTLSEFEILLDKLEPGAKAVLNNVFFEHNKFDLLAKSVTELNIFAEVLKLTPSIEIEIQGHTDNVGNVKANQILSEKRAKAVYDFLIEAGVDRKKLSYKGFGETQPADDNITEHGRAKNRRTEFLVKSL